MIMIGSTGIIRRSRDQRCRLIVQLADWGSHYDEMDMYCSPQDPGMREEFSISVYTIPEDIEEAVAAAIENLDGDELCGYIEALAAKNLAVRSKPVDVIYTMEGATAVVR